MPAPIPPQTAGLPAARRAGAARAGADDHAGARVRLPFAVALGPHRLDVEWRERWRMSRPRAVACVDLESGCIELRQDQTGLALAEAFFGCVLWLAHRRRLGVGGHLDESASHRLATGLVEFAWRNPGAWLWFNLLLSRHLPGAPRFDAAVRGILPRPPRAPMAWRHDLRELRAALAPHAADDGAAGTSATVRVIDLITQRLLGARGLGPRATADRVLKAERAGWFELMQRDPAAWRWLVWSISMPGRGGHARH